MTNVEKTPDQEWRQQRLDALAEHTEIGGRAALGRALGYKDGAYVRQMIAGERAITEKTVAKVDALRHGRFRGWFDRPGYAAAPPPAAVVAAEPPAPQLNLPPEIRQLLADLADLPPAKQSRFIDLIHIEAEEARAAAEHVNRRRSTTALSRKSHGTASATVGATLGDGNPAQGTLPLFNVDDPFLAHPSDNERALYDKIRTHPR